MITEDMKSKANEKEIVQEMQDIKTKTIMTTP